MALWHKLLSASALLFAPLWLQAAEVRTHLVLGAQPAAVIGSGYCLKWWWTNSRRQQTPFVTYFPGRSACQLS